MSVADTASVLSPVEFKIQGVKVKVEEMERVITLLLDMLNLTVVRSVLDPNKLALMTRKDFDNDDSTVPGNK